MAAVGNYRNKDERMTLKDFNENWSARRRRAIESGQALRTTAVQGVFGTNVTVVQQQTLNSIQGSASTYSSTTAVMARINLLV